MAPSAGSHQPTFRASQFLATGGQVEFTGRQRLEPLNCALMRRIALPTSGTFRAGPPRNLKRKGSSDPLKKLLPPPATRRISHGPAIRHQQPSRPGLQQHGRHNRGLGRNVDRRRALFCAADGCLGGHLHVEPVSEQACSLSLSWFGHNVASDFDRDDWLLTLLSSGCAHAFKPETYCANPDRTHRNDSHGVFG